MPNIYRESSTLDKTLLTSGDAESPNLPIYTAAEPPFSLVSQVVSELISPGLQRTDSGDPVAGGF